MSLVGITLPCLMPLWFCSSLKAAQPRRVLRGRIRGGDSRCLSRYLSRTSITGSRMQPVGCCHSARMRCKPILAVYSQAQMLSADARSRARLCRAHALIARAAWWATGIRWASPSFSVPRGNDYSG